MGPSSLASWAQLIARELARRGVDARALFREAKLPFDQLQDPNSRYPSTGLQRLWRLAADATQDPCFGLEVGRAWHPTTFHALGYSALAAASLREALGYLVRYCRVVSTGARMDLVDDGHEARVLLSAGEHGAPWQSHVSSASVQAGLASVIVLCRLACGGRVTLERVAFENESRAGAARLEKFFGCPVSFGADHNAVVFRSDELDRALPAANPSLLRINEHALNQYLARIGPNDLVAAVRSLLVRMLPSGEVHQNTIARALNMSSRSMQRKLQQQGISFRELLDETRRALAAQYTADGTLSASEVAYLLGFAEPSSYSRAMRRWNRRDTFGEERERVS